MGTTTYINVFDFDEAGLDTKAHTDETTARYDALDYAHRYMHTIVDDGVTIKRVKLCLEATSKIQQLSEFGTNRVSNGYAS